MEKGFSRFFCFLYMETKKTRKNEEKYLCIKCDFKCRWKSDWSRHLGTSKHLMETNGNNLETDKNEKPLMITDQQKLSNKCIKCDKYYKTRSGLWKHEKICSIKQMPADNSGLTPGIVIDLLKQSNEFKNLIMEQTGTIQKQSDALLKSNEVMLEMSKKISAGTTNSNNRITNNITNHFNLNLFLNDTCKDAINISDFIENIQIQMKELENVGTNGYVSGITDIILSRLKELDVSKRPVHCTDLKREILYVRDENEWNKDSEEKSKIKNMITKIADKNYRKIPEWRREHPACQEPEHQQYDFCINLMRNSLGDLGDEQIKLDNKIVKNIAKQVLVDKTTS